jgi:hypothetical protein
MCCWHAGLEHHAHTTEFELGQNLTAICNYTTTTAAATATDNNNNNNNNNLLRQT